MRVMHEPRGAGKEYWEYFMIQASLVSNMTHHRWGAAEDIMTPPERKTGRPPSVAEPRQPNVLPGVRAPT
eukprot:6178072-Pleurochrysis_carterae.AAC.5